MTQEAHSVQQSLDDASVVDLLLPEIHDFLAYLGNLHTTPRLAHLTLIPETAVPANAVLSGLEEMRQRGEPCRVARVRMGSDLGTGEKKGAGVSEKGSAAAAAAAADSEEWPAGREFSDWGRFGDSISSTDASRSGRLLWWNDEDMARRLARHLQPTAAPAEQQSVPAVQTPVQEAVEARIPSQKEEKNKGGWSMRRWGQGSKEGGGGSSGNSTYATKTVQRDVEKFPGKQNETSTLAGNRKARERRDSEAKMSVTAEEVAFRSENDFGLMESIRGWAVVVVVQVRT